MYFNEKNADFYLNDYYFYKNIVATDNMKIENTYNFLSDIKVNDSIIGTHNLVAMGSIQANTINVKGDLICFNNIKAEDIDVGGKLICFGEISTSHLSLGDNSYINRGNTFELNSNANLYVNQTFELNSSLKVHNAIFMDGIFGDGNINANNVIVDSFCDIERVNSTNKYINLVSKEESSSDINNNEEFFKTSNPIPNIKVTNIFTGEIEEIKEEFIIIKSDIGRCRVNVKDSLTNLNTYKNKKIIKFSVKDISTIGNTEVLDATRKDIFINKLFYNEVSKYDIKSIFIKEINIENDVEILIFSPNFGHSDFDKLKEIESKISIELDKAVEIKLL